MAFAGKLTANALAPRGCSVLSTVVWCADSITT